MIEELPSGHADAGNAGVPAGNSGRADEDVGVPKGGVPKREWYSRGYLPHRDRVGLLQSITFRLADSLPQEKLRELDAELACLSEERRDAERRRKIEEWLDQGMGCCALGHPAVAQLVRDALLYFDGERYQLLAWCIMPNHVHLLVEPRHPIARVVQGWKSVTSRQVLTRNEELQLRIPDPRHLWMREYWDRYIRDDNHLRRVTDYIHNNPVKAGLCRQPEEWPWSSAGNAGVLAGNMVRADGDVGVPGKKADA